MHRGDSGDHSKPSLHEPAVFGTFVGIYGDISVDSMAKERTQRDGLIAALQFVRTSAPELYPDFILVSDADEVLHRDVLRIHRVRSLQAL